MQFKVGCLRLSSKENKGKGTIEPFFLSDLNFRGFQEGRVRQRDAQLATKKGKKRKRDKKRTIICVGTRVIRATRSVSNDLLQLSLPIWTRAPTKTFPVSLLSTLPSLSLPDFISKYLEHFANSIPRPNLWINKWCSLEIREIDTVLEGCYENLQIQVGETTVKIENFANDNSTCRKEYTVGISVILVRWEISGFCCGFCCGFCKETIKVADCWITRGVMGV